MYSQFLSPENLLNITARIARLRSSVLLLSPPMMAVCLSIAKLLIEVAIEMAEDSSPPSTGMQTSISESANLKILEFLTAESFAGRRIEW